MTHVRHCAERGHCTRIRLDRVSKKIFRVGKYLVRMLVQCGGNLGIGGCQACSRDRRFVQQRCIAQLRFAAKFRAEDGEGEGSLGPVAPRGALDQSRNAPDAFCKVSLLPSDHRLSTPFIHIA